MSWSAFDPDQFTTASLPALLRPLHRAYLWASRRVTGNSTHAVNGLAVWLLIGGPLWLPLTTYWLLPVAFYSWRELPNLFQGKGDIWDHINDVTWVYAVGFALWFPAGPWYVPVVCGWMLVTCACQAVLWSHPAPEWMPRDRFFLWGDR